MSNGPEARKDAAAEALHRLGVIQPGAGAGGKDPIKEMEAFIASIEDITKRETLQAKLREIKADTELRAREAEERLRKGGDKVNEREGAERWSVVDGKPIKDPDGEYESFAQAYKVAALGTQAAAVAAAEKNNPLAFFEFLQKQGILGGKTDSFQADLAKRYLDNIDNQLKVALESKGKPDATIQELRNELASVREEARRAADPIELMTRSKALIENMRAAGIGVGGESTGEPLEVIKEKNRHEERKIELQTEKDYKTGMVDAVGNLAEDIGAGAASQVLQRKEVPKEKTGGVLETFACPKCQATIYVTPETGRVKCASCGAEWDRPKA